MSLSTFRLSTLGKLLRETRKMFSILSGTILTEGKRETRPGQSCRKCKRQTAEGLLTSPLQNSNSRGDVNERTRGAECFRFMCAFQAIARMFDKQGRPQ